MEAVLLIIQHINARLMYRVCVFGVCVCLCVRVLVYVRA